MLNENLSVCRISDPSEATNNFCKKETFNNNENIISELQINCPYCKNKYKNPKFLLCLHTFCLECICKFVSSDINNTIDLKKDAKSKEDIFKHKDLDCREANSSPFFQANYNIFTNFSNAINVKCPSCNTITKIPTQENDENIHDIIAKLPKNFIIHDMITLNDLIQKCYVKFNTHEDLSLDNDIFCTSCVPTSTSVNDSPTNQVSDKIAIGRCLECLLFLCNTCVEAHKFMKCFHNHTVLTFAEMFGILTKIVDPKIIYDGMSCKNNNQKLSNGYGHKKEDIYKLDDDENNNWHNDPEDNGNHQGVMFNCSLNDSAADEDDCKNHDTFESDNNDHVNQNVEKLSCSSSFSGSSLDDQLTIVPNKSSLALLSSLKCTFHCQNHQNEKVKYYCETCQLLLCFLCLESHQFSFKHHSCQVLDQNLEEKTKKQLLTYINSTFEKTRVLEMHTSSLENHLCTLDSQQEEIRDKCLDYKDKCHELIDKYFDEALKSIVQSHTTYELNIMDAFQAIKKVTEGINDSLKFAKHALKYCNISEILSLKPFINRRFNELCTESLNRMNEKYECANSLNLKFDSEIPAQLESILKLKLIQPIDNLKIDKQLPRNIAIMNGAENQKINGVLSYSKEGFDFMKNINNLDKNEADEQHCKIDLNSPSESTNVTPFNFPDGINPSSALATNIMGLAALAKLGNQQSTLSGNSLDTLSPLMESLNDSSLYDSPSSSNGPENNNVLSMLSSHLTGNVLGVDGDNNTPQMFYQKFVNPTKCAFSPSNNNSSNLINSEGTKNEDEDSLMKQPQIKTASSLQQQHINDNLHAANITLPPPFHLLNFPGNQFGGLDRDRISAYLENRMAGNKSNLNRPEYLTANINRLISLSSINNKNNNNNNYKNNNNNNNHLLHHQQMDYQSCYSNNQLQASTLPTNQNGIINNVNNSFIDSIMPPNISSEVTSSHSVTTTTMTSSSPCIPSSVTAAILMNFMHNTHCQLPSRRVQINPLNLPSPFSQLQQQHQHIPNGPPLNINGSSMFITTPPSSSSSSSTSSNFSTNLHNQMANLNGLTPKMNIMKVRVKFGSLGPGNMQFNSPHGFCLGVDEEIIVADTNNHRIQVYTKDGMFKGSFGIPGREEGQLWYPRKVTVNKMNGKFVVCDRGSERSRMQIFDRNGNFLKKVPIRYIDIVAGLAITEVGSPGGAGHIVAVDSVTPTVFRIAETGDLLHWFDCSEYMREPSDVAVRGDEYYVCDFKGHCVAVFTESGQFLRKIGRDTLTNFPNGIDVSEAGEVLVGDSHGNRFHVAVFRGQDGLFMAEFECPHVKVSRCCGLKITSEGHIVTLAKNNHYVLVLDTLFVPP